MKITAYSIKACEKEYLTRANNKQHDITLISNNLNRGTVSYAKGKDVILVFPGEVAKIPSYSPESVAEHARTFEGLIFHFDHKGHPLDDQLLSAFIRHSNMLITPHEAVLTKEAQEMVAKHTILNLNHFLGEGGLS